MHPVSNRQTTLYRPAKPHRLKYQKDITRENIKCQTPIYTYNSLQGISNYLKTRCKNEYTINNNQSFFSKISKIISFGRR